MNEPELRQLLTDLQSGLVSLDGAVAALQPEPPEALSFARIDYQRAARRGSPEVVFCDGKTPEQAATIFARLVEHDGRALATRASPAHAQAITAQTPPASYHAAARLVVLGQAQLPAEAAAALVLVATGGTADIPVAEEAALTAEFNGCRVTRLWDVGIAGVHRLLAESQLLAEAAVIIAVAGMDGALPGLVAGLAACPVIAVPTAIGYGTGLGGVAALMNMLNACAPGVAVVNIDNGFGAGYLAAAIVRGRGAHPGQPMKTAYFDCFAGASGDMILGALLDAGLDRAALVARLEQLKLPGWTLDARPVTKNGLAATAVKVIHAETSVPRTLADISALITASALPEVDQTQALRIFQRLAEAEASVHGTTPAEVHFHEVGAVDAIVDIVGAACGLSLLGVQAVQASPLPLGRGFTRSAHGILPLPAPAVVELLRGVPLASTTATGETVTPTGAAILVTLASGFGPIPAMRLERVGYGAGSREADYPNVLRVLIGETEADADRETLVELATNIDDLNPQLYEHVFARLFAAGALDVWLLPAQMKKGRPGSVFSVLCRPEHEAALSEIIFRETTTLGLRRQLVERQALAREVRRVTTRYGQARVKLALLAGDILRAMPEYEDCRLLAESSGAPLREVMLAVEQAALGADPPGPPTAEAADVPGTPSSV